MAAYKYILVDKNHPICKSKPPKQLNIRMKTFWIKRGLPKCTGTVLYMVDNNIAGFFRFSEEEKVLYACGTYILSKYRRKNVAKNMWKKAIEQTNPHYIDITVTSFGAVKLIKSLQKKYKNINFLIEWHLTDQRWWMLNNEKTLCKTQDEFNKFVEAAMSKINVVF